MFWRRQNEDRWRAAVKAMAVMNWSAQPAYHDELLTLCNTLITENRYELAVVVAQMACEIVAEQMLTPLLKGGRKPWNFNLASKEPLRLYKSLTRDPIDAAAFWPTYTVHATRRHEVVHRGQRVNETEARESFNAARQFVMHLGTVRKGLSQ